MSINVPPKQVQPKAHSEKNKHYMSTTNISVYKTRSNTDFHRKIYKFKIRKAKYRNIRNCHAILYSLNFLWPEHSWYPIRNACMHACMQTGYNAFTLQLRLHFTGVHPMGRLINWDTETSPATPPPNERITGPLNIRWRMVETIVSYSKTRRRFKPSSFQRIKQKNVHRHDMHKQIATPPVFFLF